jgi:hypothetical protein
MKTITNLTGTVGESQWTEPYGISSSVHDERVPGAIRAVQLGSAGVTVRLGATVVGIPLEEILKLAESMEPALVVNATAQKTVTPAARVAAAAARLKSAARGKAGGANAGQ